MESDGVTRPTQVKGWKAARSASSRQWQRSPPKGERRVMAACPVKETGGIQQTGKPDQFWLPLASSWLDGELKLLPKLFSRLLAMATGAASMRPAG
jgi:hypothetical protein